MLLQNVRFVKCDLEITVVRHEILLCVFIVTKLYSKQLACILRVYFTRTVCLQI